MLFIFAGLSLLSIYSKFSSSKLSGVTIFEETYLTDEIDFKPSDDVKKEPQWNELSMRKAFAAHDFGLNSNKLFKNVRNLNLLWKLNDSLSMLSL